MSKLPKVSVIIPTHNREFCIERAIRSVQNQILDNIEIIVCDDASTDNTLEIVHSYQVKDPRIKFLKLRENQGPGAARNAGMVAARGDYIAFLDSDDEWLPEKLARQVECMDLASQEIGVCLCGAIIVKNDSDEKPVLYSPDKGWETDTLRQFVTGKMVFFTPTILFRRKCLCRSKLMVSEMRRNEDIEFLLRLFLNYGLCVVPDAYTVIHLVVSTKNKHYEELRRALPYRLNHRKIIQKRLGFMAATYYVCLLRSNLFHNALRERRWIDAKRDFQLRIQEFPLIFPKEFLVIIKVLFRLVYEEFYFSNVTSLHYNIRKHK